MNVKYSASCRRREASARDEDRSGSDEGLGNGIPLGVPYCACPGGEDPFADCLDDRGLMQFTDDDVT